MPILQILILTVRLLSVSENSSEPADVQTTKNQTENMQDQDVAAMKVKAVYDYIQSRLPEGSFWECGTDLENDIDLYLPNADESGNCGDVYISLTDITLLDGRLDANSQERIERILQDRSL